jgi:tripartite ATP-independent transporter DctP family solute receptor
MVVPLQISPGANFFTVEVVITPANKYINRCHAGLDPASRRRPGESRESEIDNGFRQCDQLSRAKVSCFNMEWQEDQGSVRRTCLWTDRFRIINAMLHMTRHSNSYIGFRGGKMKRLRMMVALTGLVGLVGLILFMSEPAQSAEITLRYSGNLPVQHHVTIAQQRLAKYIEEKSGGRVKVAVYPAGQLFQDKDMMQAVPKGAVDMASVTLAQWTGLVPTAAFIDLPFYYKDHQHIWRVCDGKPGEIMRKELERVGVKFLHWMDYGVNEFASKMPLRTLEDFKGKRIRGLTEYTTESIKALGAAPTFLGGGEVYMALQRGTVDGAISGTSSFWERKYFEVTKYATIVNQSFSIFAAVMNLKKWNELPPDIQKIVMAGSLEAQEWIRKEAEKQHYACIDLIKNKGMEIIYPTKEERERWKKANEPVINIFRTRTGELGQQILAESEKLR